MSDFDYDAETLRLALARLNQAATDLRLVDAAVRSVTKSPGDALSAWSGNARSTLEQLGRMTITLEQAIVVTRSP